MRQGRRPAPSCAPDILQAIDPFKGQGNALPEVCMKLQKGSIAPEFTAKDFNGRDVSLSTLRGEGPVVLIFLRGFS